MSEITVLSEWRQKQESSSGSKSQSKRNTMSEKHGQMSTDQEIMDATMAVVGVVLHAHTAPFTTKSDFARKMANEVALCASEGLISTQMETGRFTNRWLVTREGLDFLDAMEDVLSD